MLKVIFFLKPGKANTKGESPVFARISHNQQSIDMTTSKRISKERWQFTNNLRNVLKLEKEKVLKHALDILVEKPVKLTTLFQCKLTISFGAN
ncbi:hypothetical protein [Flavobacterium sp. PL12]|uniref:hypothetical protein n=1 Tax=Flavobacterium sp. PL12 TaxID=3071718 RepID=UPI00319D9FAF